MIKQTVFPFKLEITKEKLTALSGLSLIAEYAKSLNCSGLINRFLPSPKSNRGFKPSVFVKSIMFTLLGGGNSLEDIRELKRESSLMELIENETIPDPDSIGNWLKRMGKPETGEQGLIGLDKTRQELTKRILKHDGVKEYTLDADATEILALDKYEAKMDYKGNKGYMPMLGFLYETPVCIYDEFREGNVSPGTAQKEFYLECQKRMPKNKRISFYRADSASYNGNLINQLEADNVIYAITADLNKGTRKVINKITDWVEPEPDCGYEIAETVYTMDKTKKAFRLVVRREIPRQPELFKDPYFYHIIATNWDIEEKSAVEVMEWHNQRGQAENFNKELKNGFGMRKMPCGKTYANAVFFRIGVLAYNLFIGFKRLTCPLDWHKHTIGTFRWKMIQIAGRIISHGRELILKIKADLEKLELFNNIRKRIYELRFT